MHLKLSKPFISNSAVDEFDTKQVKKTLNRLGYYTPYEKTGITGMPDTQVFTALKQFQTDQGLTASGEMRPGDETEKVLRREAGKTPDGSYIWRSVGDDRVRDDRVRDDHARYNGTVRKWADSPDPGEEFNCRCWAERLDVPEAPKKRPEGLRQVVVSTVNDASEEWNDLEFLWHFYTGNGQEKNLSEIGLLQAVIDHAKAVMFDKVLAQIIQKAKQTNTGMFTGFWDNAYDFQNVVYSLGGVTIRGRFFGEAQRIDKNLVIHAQAEYEFYDAFTDPIRAREFLFGTSNIEVLPPSLLGGFALTMTDLRGTAYSITGQWTTKITGSILIEQ